MSKLIIGKSRLEGQVRVGGAKNSVLRLLAASLLTKEKLVLQNYPATLLDARLHVRMLEKLGKRCSVDEERHEITIEEGFPPPGELVWDERSIRNTLLVLGALTARTGAGKVPLPGGCKLGERQYDIHVMALETLGAEVWEDGDCLCAAVKHGGRLKGADIHLPMRSTGATENSILAACLAEGRSRIWGPHIRPEILDLISMLREMGAEIQVNGQESISVEGREELGPAVHQAIPDNVEALTWMIGAIITGGDLEIIDFPYEHLEVPLIHLRESGGMFYRNGNRMIVRGGRCYPVDLSTGPYPGINSDMQPLFAVYGAVANGESRIIDLRFPGRYGYMEELSKMGVSHRVRDNLLMISGPTRWKGAEVNALDLRAGAALMLAGMMADGQTRIENFWQIERGYSDLFAKLANLGVDFSVQSSS
jgi:UDP-N-acetylglucosamine 1-carboxyvinyltransferase